MKAPSIQKSSIVPVPAEKPEVYKKPVLRITACVLLILIGLLVVTLGAIGLIPLAPGIILGGILAIGTLVGLTVCLFKYHKDKKLRASLEILGKKESSPVLPSATKEPIQVKLPDLTASIIDLSEGPTEEQTQLIQELHTAVRSDEPVSEEVKERLKLEILTSSTSSKIYGIAFTSGHFPGIIFKSMLSFNIPPLEASLGIARGIIEEKNLDLLYIPKTYSKTNLVLGKWQLLLEEHLNLESDVSDSVLPIPAYCQLFRFLGETGWRGEKGKHFMVLGDKLGPKGEAVLGLIKTYSGLDRKGDRGLVMRFTLRNLLRMRTPGERKLLREVAKICLEYDAGDNMMRFMKEHGLTTD